MSLTNRILIAMVAGILLGSLLNVLLHGADLPPGLRVFLDQSLVGGLFDVVGRIFVASLKLLVVPLVLVSLICGASSLGDSARMGPIAAQDPWPVPGHHRHRGHRCPAVCRVGRPRVRICDLVDSVTFEATAPPPLTDVLVDIFPSNPVRAMADGKMLQIIVFALLVGYAISHAGEPGRRIASFFRDLEAVVMKMVEILMALAPYGVFALLAKLFATMGLGAILDLAAYFFTVLAVLLFHALVVYGLLFRATGGIVAAACCSARCGRSGPSPSVRRPPAPPCRSPCAPWSGAWACTTRWPASPCPWGPPSTWTAPPSCRVWPPYLSPRCTAWTSLPLRLLTVILTATLASIGTAAVPGVGLITLALVLEQAGLPVEGIALIIGVDRLLDMVRTAVNVTGDMMVAVIVGRSEGQFDEAVFLADEKGQLQEPQDDTTPIF